MLPCIDLQMFSVRATFHISLILKKKEQETVYLKKYIYTTLSIYNKGRGHIVTFQCESRPEGSRHIQLMGLSRLLVLVKWRMRAW